LNALAARSLAPEPQHHLAGMLDQLRISADVTGNFENVTG
jgi:hypothetical protein